jgi:hypothetical protein
VCVQPKYKNLHIRLPEIQECCHRILECETHLTELCNVNCRVSFVQDEDANERICAYSVSKLNSLFATMQIILFS